MNRNRDGGGDFSCSFLAIYAIHANVENSTFVWMLQMNTIKIRAVVLLGYQLDTHTKT